MAPRNGAVLVVDDYGMMRRIIRNQLNQLGFANVEEAADGEGALQLLQQEDRPFALIISDWYMEPMNGYQLLLQIRADPRFKRLPFIMITAESTTDNVVAAKAAGVSNYIIKPFTADTLRKKIDSVLAVSV